MELTEPRSGERLADAQNERLLDARDVEVTLDGTTILRGASLAVRRGEVHVLIGPNGAGKTTFANAVTGHVPIAGGTVELRGTPLRGPVVARTRRGVGRKFQVPRVFPRLTAKRNLAVARRAPHVAPDAASEHAVAVLDRGRHDDGDTGASGLSHGDRQHLEMEMVLVQRPALAVLDEPTAGMTRAERRRLATLIREAAGRETFLIVEHDMDFVETVADSVSFMAEGRVLATGAFADIASDPRVRSAYLGAARPELGRRAAAGPGTARPDARGALRAAGVTVSRDRLETVRDISFDLPAGGALGVLGRNGAGKTTLLEGLMGLLEAAGEVTVDDVAMSGRPAWWRARHGMALVPQGRQLFPALTVAENLQIAAIGAQGDGAGFDVHALFPALRALLPRKAGLLSGGEQQQVAIARALLRRPAVLLLDEPTEGLSPIVVQEITRVLEHLVGEGLTIVLAEQQRAIVEQLCGSFLMLRSGESAGAGPIVKGAIERFYERL
jgi:branched-chain amino acid transport system ATP-binding protein